MESPWKNWGLGLLSTILGVVFVASMTTLIHNQLALQVRPTYKDLRVILAEDSPYVKDREHIKRELEKIEKLRREGNETRAEILVLVEANRKELTTLNIRIERLIVTLEKIEKSLEGFQRKIAVRAHE